MARLPALVFTATVALLLGGLVGCSLINLDDLDPAPASSDAAGGGGGSDATLAATDETGTQSDDSNSSVTMSSDSAEPDAATLPLDSGGEGSPAAPEASAEDAPSESGSSTRAEASADVASPSVCASGNPLVRDAWATNPGTTASDSTCGPIDGIFNMFDGLLTTRWSTARAQTLTPPEWLEIDLGCPQTFSELVLDATDYTLDYPRGYTVQVSSDATTWSQVSSGAGSMALTRITFPPTTARYIKVLQTGVASSFWTVDELNVCGTTDGTCAPTAYPRAGWATNPGTSASDNQAGLGNMFDGSLSTRWTSNRAQTATPPLEWVEVDMGVSQPVSQVILQNFDDCTDYPRTVTLQASTDNSTWTPLATGSGSAPFTAISFSATMARYIKITETAASVSFWSIDELVVLP